MPAKKKESKKAKKKPSKAPSKLSSVTKNGWSFSIRWKNPSEATKGDHKWSKIYVRVSLDLSVDNNSPILLNRQVKKTTKKGNVKLKKKKKSSISNPSVTNAIKLNTKRSKKVIVNWWPLSNKATSFTLNTKKWGAFDRNEYYGGKVTNTNRNTVKWKGSHYIDAIIFEVQGYNDKSKRSPNYISVTPGVPAATTQFNFVPPSFKGGQSFASSGKSDNHIVTSSVDFIDDPSSKKEIQYVSRTIMASVNYEKDKGGFKSTPFIHLPKSNRVIYKSSFEKNAEFNPGTDVLQELESTVEGDYKEYQRRYFPTQVLRLTPGEAIYFKANYIIYGVQGTAKLPTKKFIMAYPHPTKISSVDTSDDHMYVINFYNDDKKGGEYKAESYVLEILRNYRPDGSDEWSENQWKEAALAEDSGWKEVYTIGSTERAFSHNKQKAKPEKYSRTFYRIRCDNKDFDSIYSPPFMVPDFVSVPNPKDEKVKFLEALPTDDGKSIKITYGWTVTTTGTQANSDGTEISWSPDEYAWRSNQKPDVLLMPDEDFEADDVKISDLSDPEKRPSWAGDEIMGEISLMYEQPPKADVRLALLWNKQNVDTDKNGSIYITGLDLYGNPVTGEPGTFEWKKNVINVNPIALNVSNKLPTNRKIYLVYRINDQSGAFNYVWENSGWKGVSSTYSIPNNYTFQTWNWNGSIDAVLGAFKSKSEGSGVSLNTCMQYGYPLNWSIVSKYDSNLVKKLGVVYIRGLNEGTPYYLKLRRALSEGMEETRYAAKYAVFTGNTLGSSDKIIPLTPSTKPTNLILEGPDAIAEGDDFSVSWTFEATSEQTQWMMLYAKPYEDGDGSSDHDVEVVMDTDPELNDTKTSKVGDNNYTTTNNKILANPMPLFHVTGDNTGKVYGGNDAKGYARITYEDIENLLIDNILYLTVQVQTSGAFVQSNIISIRVAKAPKIEVLDFSDKLEQMPLSIAFRSSVNTLDVKLVIKARGSHVWRPDGADAQVDGQVVYSKYLKAAQDILWTTETVSEDQTNTETNTENNNSSTDDSGNNDSGTNNGTNDNGTDDNGTDDNGTDDNSTDDNGTDDNGTDDNGTDDGTDDNGTDDNGTDDSNVQENSEMIYVTEYTITDSIALHDMGQYDIEILGIDSETSLTTDYGKLENEDPLTVSFEVDWKHQAVAPSFRSYILKNPNCLGVDIYIKSAPGIIDTDVCDIYRVTPDGAYLVLEGQPFNTVVTDRYAPFSKTAFTRYRLCTRTLDGDIEWTEIGYRLKETCIRLDWDMGYLDTPSYFETGISLPYNVRISDSLEKNFESRLHMDGQYAGYWNDGIKRTGSLSTDIIKVSDPIEKEKIRALGRYPGPVYVRTPDGCAYTANVTVKTIPYEYNSQIMAIQLDAQEIQMADQFMINRIEKPFITEPTEPTEP